LKSLFKQEESSIPFWMGGVLFEDKSHSFCAIVPQMNTFWLPSVLLYIYLLLWPHSNLLKALEKFNTHGWTWYSKYNLANVGHKKPSQLVQTFVVYKDLDVLLF
jgi:hypothetical protein